MASELTTSAPVAGTPARQSERVDDLGIAVWEGGKACADNFDGDETQRFQRRLLCMSDAAKGGDHLNEVILVRYWLVHEVQIMQDDGEIVPCYRVVLVTPDNKAYGFVSEVLARGVREIYMQFGREPLDPPLPVRIKQKPTSKGRRCYVLVPVLEGAKK